MKISEMGKNKNEIQQNKKKNSKKTKIFLKNIKIFPIYYIKFN